MSSFVGRHKNFFKKNGAYIIDLTKPILDPNIVYTGSNYSYIDRNGVTKISSPNVWDLDHDPVTKKPIGRRAFDAATNRLRYSRCHTGFVATGVTPPNVVSDTLWINEPATRISFISGLGGHSESRAERSTAGYSTTATTVGWNVIASIYVSLSRPLTGSELITIRWEGGDTGIETVINASNSTEAISKYHRSTLSYTVGISGNVYPTIYASNLTEPLDVYVNRGQFSIETSVHPWIETFDSVLTGALDTPYIPMSLFGLTSSGFTIYFEFFYDHDTALFLAQMNDATNALNDNDYLFYSNGLVDRIRFRKYATTEPSSGSIYGGTQILNRGQINRLVYSMIPGNTVIGVANGGTPTVSNFADRLLIPDNNFYFGRTSYTSSGALKGWMRKIVVLPFPLTVDQSRRLSA